MEYVFTRGKDFFAGEQIGLDTGTIHSYDRLVEAVKEQITHMVNAALAHIAHVETYYMDVGPDPLLSAVMAPCVENGIDAYAGGARYNNSSFYMHSIATLADSLAAVRRHRSMADPTAVVGSSRLPILPSMFVFPTERKP